MVDRKDPPPPDLELVWIPAKEYSASLSGSLEDIGHAAAVEEQTDGSMVIVNNGIHLRQKDEAQPFALFSYALAPFSTTPVQIDWKIVSVQPIVGQHILCHQLQPGENVEDIVSSCESDTTRALVLVNSEPSFILPGDYKWNDDVPRPPYPVCVMQCQEGQHLLEMIQRFEVGEVFACVQSVSMTEAEAKRALSPVGESSLSLSLDLTTGTSRRKIRLPFQKPRVDLKKRIKAKMTSPTSGPLCVSDNTDLFQQVMQEFNGYEQAALDKAHAVSDNGRVFQKLLKFIGQEGVFEKDAAFYILLAYRVVRKKTVYQCEELVQFIQKCIVRFEELTTQKKLDSMLKFIQSGDFDIQYDADFANTSVFRLLEKACVFLMNESQKMKHRGMQSSSQRHYLLCKMIWLSLSLKFRSEVGSRDGSKLWYDHLTKDPFCYSMDAQTIFDLVYGLEVGLKLKLPVNSCFRAEQMSALLASGEFVRPFGELSEFLKRVESFLHVPEDFLLFFVVKLREPYRACLQGSNKKLGNLSSCQSLLGAIEEGLEYLGCLCDIWNKKKWTSPNFDKEMLEWIYLLLGGVDITSDRATTYLKEFVSPSSPAVTVKYKKQIINQIVSKTRQSFRNLNILKFCHLYKSFYIWSLDVVSDYFQVLGIPPKIKVCDDVWVNFFKEVVERFGGAHNHTFILEFFITAADRYLEERRPKEFIFDLLSMNIPGLFAVEKGSGHESKSVAITFQTFLKEYIQRHHLIPGVITHVSNVWRSITQMSDFQLLILSVLQKELIPESRNLQAPIKESVNLIVTDTIKLLCHDASWVTDLNPHHKFAFGVVSICCSHLPVSNTLDWASSYSEVVKKLGSVYLSYCKANGVVGKERFLSEIPDNIANSSLDAIHDYFQWIVQVHCILNDWKHRFSQKLLNFDEIEEYRRLSPAVHDVAIAVGAEVLMVDPDEVEAYKNQYLQLFEKLNVHLIKYIPGHPEAGWLPLTHFLQEYGIEIPESVASPISQQIVFPNEDSSSFVTLLAHPLTPSVTGVFNPAHDVSLQLTVDVTLQHISKLVADLDDLLYPVQDNIDLLIYFFLHKSTIFDTYLRYQLQKHSEVDSDALNVVSATSALVSSIRRGSKPFKGMSWKTLTHALLETKNIILKLIEGTAHFTEITAGGTLALDQIDVHLEFNVLIHYTKYMNMQVENYDGLRGVQCMLELFQYLHHVQCIYNVCKQYHLDGCLADSRLLDIKEIADGLQEVTHRDQLTPKEAISMMDKMVKFLCLRKKEGFGYNKRCLQLFPAVADSVMFYQFIKDKEFFGVSGQEVFYQKYGLITAQLQHEEYNEVVLNHLYTAFKVMSPFMDNKQDFESLMLQLNEMTITSGQQELETVNRNIHLVRLWFSRAEEDSLEMVPSELVSILASGEYQFEFGVTSNGVKAQLFLEYQPSIVAQSQIPLVASEVSGDEVNEHATLPHQGVSTLSEKSTVTSSLQEVLSTSSNSVAPLRIQRWNNEQIRDFEQRLGFLDPDETVQKNIQKFLMLNQNAYQLIDLFQQLRDLGHPSYATEETSTHKVAFRADKDATQEKTVLFFAMSCTWTEEDVVRKVKETAEKLRLWSLEVADLQSNYKNLLFFSIPKLLVLHKSVKENHVDDIVKEISFLFKNNTIVREKLKTNVKLLLPRLETVLESSPAMEAVGCFLQKLITEHEMAKYALKVRHPYRQLSRSISSQASTILNLCHSVSSAQLLALIINSYNGVPESFQLLRCQSSTSEEELHLFLKRVVQHSYQYMVIGVEKLQYDLQEFLLQYQLTAQPAPVGDADIGACLHFVETGPSIIREMPWILVKEHKDEIALNFDRAKKICCQDVVSSNEDFQCITLVYGKAGDGKTHFIKSKLQKRLEHMILQIPINESFSALAAIKKLQKLPTGTRGCCVYFNFTVLPPAESGSKMEERQQYKELMYSVNWFFFDLLILGYVEDSATGSSFRLPGGLSWAIFVEVPSCDDVDPQVALQHFLTVVPSLGLVGNKELIDSRKQYQIDCDVQIVCKYLKAFEMGGKHGIDKLYKETRRRQSEPVKFSVDPDLPCEECYRLLAKYVPLHLKRNKTTQTFFIRYMKRRCYFLDNLPAYNYNTGAAEMVFNTKGRKVHSSTQHLGSTLMRAFLREVEEFCHPKAQANWSKNPHQQLIYDCIDGGASIGLISLRTDELPEEDKRRFEEIGIQLHSMMDLHSREVLDDFLSRALSVPLDDTGHLGIIDENDYVLTLDYTLKMLNINERCECNMPVVIEGETGVGKTALVEMLSKLWNSNHFSQWKKSREHIIDMIQNKIEDILSLAPEQKQSCLDALTKLSEGKNFTVEDIELIAGLRDPHSPSSQFYSVLLEEALKLKTNSVLSLLEHSKYPNFSSMFRKAENSNNLKATCSLLFALLSAQIRNTFYKLNVHAALKPADIMAFFTEVIDQAYEILDAFQKQKNTEMFVKVPTVTVFLDEVNTASCLGLFKEIMVDRSIDGMPLPSNIFIIAACNPHRGDSLAHLSSKESWVRSSYYVRVLHPTLDMFKWDCGALDESQERDYINAKLKIINQKEIHQLPSAELASLTELVVTSQNLMRDFSYSQLLTSGVNESDAKVCSQSCVSQRDIQRVFTFYDWLMKVYNKLQPHGHDEDYHNCAIMVSLGIVYYLRLDIKYRQKYCEVMDKSVYLAGGLTFTECFQRELEWYVGQMDLPHGIAKTQALKENIFANIVCTMTRTPLIIVGPPGCSKTLSFNLVTSNLKGEESKAGLFRETEVFQSLDPHYYQCSRRTTSNEVQTVFLRAINRQRSYAKVPLPIFCVVFMDEAGLPEESLESLKVLHYHLDRKEVSFVAISNHMLDAAKTNRAVSLYRPEASVDELRTLAKGCLCDDPLHPPAELRKDIDIVVKFCPVYHKLMQRDKLKKFYGLRDFIHFVKYLRRNRRKGITEKLVMHALERNFNGHNEFENVCKEFVSVMGPSTHKQRRSILDVLKESLSDKPQDFTGANEVRYKLIVDSSEDNSLLRLLFAFGVLKERDTRTYVCSDFPGDTRQQMVNTIASIRHSASIGHTVIMSQTDEIHESFYDLFNQRFRRINDPKIGARFYSNISIGAHHKPCRVHPSFQCIVVVKSSEVDHIPHPFLNRFEKYSLTHKILLEAVLSNLPDYLRAVMQRAQDKALEFIEHVGGPSSLYGLREDTLDSLILSILPPVGFSEFIETESKSTNPFPNSSPRLFLLQYLLQSLRKRAGFRIPHFTAEELEADAEYVLQVVARDSQFDGQLRDLTVEDIVHAVPEALEALYHSQSKGGRTDLSINACMVISVFLQWLVHHLCKRLLQLMTTEALTTYYKTLPLPYTESYLQHQSHFNLKALIDKQLKVLDLDDRTDRSTTGTANRLLVFTRSSAVIHQLPSHYPARNASNPPHDYDPLIKKLVHSLPGVVTIYKLTGGSSQASVTETLDKFVKARYKQVLLLIANVHDTSPQIISHLRVMIEEADISQTNNKLFVLLLHFQSPVLYTHCYPTLFSNTWDHHYLDIIGQNNVHEVFDICEWFSHCCMYLASSHAPQEPISMHLTSLLQEAIPTISSRVFFGKNSGSSFNYDMEVPRRNVALQKLFDMGVGEILCKKFLKYWEPNVMLEYLEKAASVIAINQSAALSITESVQNILKDTFFDYVVYMVSKMNEDMNIDIIFDHSCSEAVRTLFLQLLAAYPTPKLSQLKSLSGFAKCISNVEASEKSSFVTKFPFYRLVSTAMEKIIEQTRKEINQRLDTLHEHPETSLSALSISAMPKIIEDKSHLVEAMQKTVEFRLTQLLESQSPLPLKIALQAMLENRGLWKSYNETFTHQKLRLGPSSAGISFRILKLILTQLHDEQNMLTHFALLHICVYVYQLDLARLVQILRPLDNLLDMAAVVPDDPFATVSTPSPTSSFLSSLNQSGDVLGQPGDLSVYVLNILFSALVGSVFGENKLVSPSPCASQVQENMKLWYHVYKDVMSVTAVKEYLYKLSSDICEARHNIMFATFLVLQSSPSLNFEALANAQKVFTSLYNSHLSEQHGSIQEGPNLAETTESIMRVVTGSSAEDAILQSSSLVRHLYEGLFSHFFSPHRTNYSGKDCQWFLQLANKNSQWIMKSRMQIDANLDMQWADERTRGNDDDVALKSSGCVAISVYKLYLTRILGKAEVGTVGINTSKALTLYKQWVCNLIGKVLAFKYPEEAPQVYIPAFYYHILEEPTLASNESLMQQPLAHLYFLTVLEHLLSNKFNLATVVRVANAVASALDDDDVCKEQKIILQIEHQALVQAAIQLLAKRLNPADPGGISAVANIVNDVNVLLTKGINEGHGLVLAMHLLMEVKSYNMFDELIGPSSIVSFRKDFACLNTLDTSLQLCDDYHSFAFLLSTGKNSILKDLYERVSRAMQIVHTSNGRRRQQLATVAQEWSQGHVIITLSDGSEVQAEKSCLFKMVLWLATYYKFYCLKKTSPMLVDTLRNDLLYQVQPANVNNLFCCFLDPSTMEQDPSAESDNESFTSLSPDPIYRFFNVELRQEDSAGVNLRHALANLIAVVVAAPPMATHLWYHMFSADQLCDTYMTGFMYDSPVGCDGVFYESGAQLSSQGFFTQLSHLKHSTRGTLSLQSLYLLLWANFGACCVGLLVDSSASSKMSGKIFSETLPLRQYCMTQLKTMWDHLSSSLGISVEERSLLISRSMWNFVKSAISTSSAKCGRFTTLAQLNAYEENWHTNVFTPAWRSLQQDFAKQSDLYSNRIIENMRMLDCHYPCFTTEKGLLQRLLSERSICDNFGNSKYILSQYALLRNQLEFIGSLLPDLVEFYQWLHQELAHVVTQDDATRISLRRAVRVLVKSYSAEEGERLQNLYRRLKDTYNSYASACDQSLRVLGDNTPLIHVVSCSSDSDQSQDILYVAISHVITTHNDFIMKAWSKVHSDPLSPLGHYLPEDFTRVHPTEFTDKNCIIENVPSLHGLTEFDQLIRSRTYHPPALCQDKSFSTNLPCCESGLVDMQQLQEDVFIAHVVGKPLIEPPLSVRINFNFRDDGPHSNEKLTAVEADLQIISEKLYKEFKCPVDDMQQKNLELQFHSSGYHVIMETISGLRAVAGHLVKKLMVTDNVEDISNLHSKTACEFLHSIFEMTSESLSIFKSSRSVFQEIGVQSLSRNQFKALESIKLQHLYNVLKWFVLWASQGWFEFCCLPYSMKKHLNTPVEEALENIPRNYTECHNQLMKDLKALTAVLDHFESTAQLAQTAAKEPQMAIVDFLSRLGECKEQEQLLHLIPESIQIQHYVSFRVALKQLMIGLQRELSLESSIRLKTPQKWEDFVDDLWCSKLTQFRRDDYTYAVLTTGDQKRVYTLQNIDRDDEELLNDLMKAGVSESDLLPDTDAESLGKSESGSPLMMKSSSDDNFSTIGSISPSLELRKVHKMRKAAESYTCEQVCEFLREIGMDDYVEEFQEFSITGDVLLKAEQGQGLNDLGVTNAIHRLKIYILFRRHLDGGVSKIAKRYPVGEVLRFLHCTKMSEYVETFQQNEIDGECLLEASEEALEALGVNKHIHRLSIKSQFKKFTTPLYTTL